MRDHLRRHRDELGRTAAVEYPDLLRVAGTALLSRPEWLPPEPLPLDAVDLELTPDVPHTRLSGADPVTSSVRPLRPDGSRYPTYSAAMADLAAPAVFENRVTYRLLDADLSSPRGRLVFGRGTYFDGIDIGESAAHEYAAARLDSGDTPLRDAVGDPCDPARRPVNLAISMLTVRQDRESGETRYLLHWRDPAKVGHAGGLHMVVPVGIFQPADDQPSSEQHDFSLWQCMVREYAEELLGEPEDYSGHHGVVDYDAWPFATRMREAVDNGHLRAHVLGMGVDALSFATDLLVAVVFDAPLFDELFADLVDVNAEGRLTSVSLSCNGTGDGQPLPTNAYRPMQAAGEAALALAHEAGVLRSPG